MTAGWLPEFGDPTIMGWLTVVNYCFGVVCCLRASKMNNGDRAIWIVLAIGLALLSFNKQLDLQSVLTVIAREASRSGGWFEYRRVLQHNFILALGIFVAAMVVGLMFLSRKRPGSMQLSLAGTVLLLFFVVMRAASFNQALSLPSAVIGGLAIKDALENVAILLVAAGALLAARRRPGRS